MKLKDFLPAGLAGMLGCGEYRSDFQTEPAEHAKLVPVVEFGDADLKKAVEGVRSRCTGSEPVPVDQAVEDEVWQIGNRAYTSSYNSREFDTSGTKEMDKEYAELWAGKFRADLLAALKIN